MHALSHFALRGITSSSVFEASRPNGHNALQEQTLPRHLVASGPRKLLRQLFRLGLRIFNSSDFSSTTRGPTRLTKCVDFEPIMFQLLTQFHPPSSFTSILVTDDYLTGASAIIFTAGQGNSQSIDCQRRWGYHCSLYVSGPRLPFPEAQKHLLSQDVSVTIAVKDPLCIAPHQASWEIISERPTPSEFIALRCIPL